MHKCTINLMRTVFWILLHLHGLSTMKTTAIPISIRRQSRLTSYAFGWLFWRSKLTRVITDIYLFGSFTREWMSECSGDETNAIVWLPPFNEWFCCCAFTIWRRISLCALKRECFEIQANHSAHLCDELASITTINLSLLNGFKRGFTWLCHSERCI